MPNPPDDKIRDLLTNARTVAVVGHSENPARTSYQIANYLRSVGYKIYPINPTVDQIDGQKSYASLADVPEPIDVVDVFRRPEHLPAIVAEAIAAGAKAVWGQLGVVDWDAGQKALDAGLDVVMDRCMRVEHRRLVA